MTLPTIYNILLHLLHFSLRNLWLRPTFGFVPAQLSEIKTYTASCAPCSRAKCPSSLRNYLFPQATSQVAACRHLATAARFRNHIFIRTRFCPAANEPALRHSDAVPKCRLVSMACFDSMSAFWAALQNIFRKADSSIGFT